MAMKLVAGLGSLDDLTEYAAVGADEVFIGYVPQSWQEKYGLTTPLNRREVCFYNVQIGSFSELEILAQIAQRCGVRVTVAFNGLGFRQEQYPLIGSIMEECLSVGIRDVILADLGLLLYLNQCGLAQRLFIHISGEFGEINHFMVEELEGLGAGRIIFHRKVSLSNMEGILAEYEGRRLAKEASPAAADGKKPREKGRMEFEAFLLNENCHFNGAYCNSLHCDELVPLCRMPYRLSGDNDLQVRNEEEEDRGKRESAPAYSYDYGLGNLKKLQEIGITHLKIVGRGADSDSMVQCIKICREKLEEIYE